MAGVLRSLVRFTRNKCHSGPAIASLCEAQSSEIVWSNLRLLGARRFLANSNGGGSDGKEDSEAAKKEKSGEEESPKDEEADDSDSLGLEILPAARHHAIAPVNPPENLPEVPILPLSRNPLFPRFVKMLEVYIEKVLCMCSYA